MSAMRGSSAPAMSAPLPSREQPVTAIRCVLMCAEGVCSSASMMRLTPHAQAVIADALWLLPKRL